MIRVLLTGCGHFTGNKKLLALVKEIFHQNGVEARVQGGELAHHFDGKNLVPVEARTDVDVLIHVNCFEVKCFEPRAEADQGFFGREKEARTHAQDERGVFVVEIPPENHRPEWAMKEKSGFRADIELTARRIRGIIQRWRERRDL